MREITLHNGMVAKVSDEDHERLSAYHWTAAKAARAGWYARRMVYTRQPDGSTKMTCLGMHRDVLDPGMVVPGSIWCDHIDRDGLNNQRDNLRWKDKRGNNLNRRIHRRNTSGYRGVSVRSQENGTWAAWLMSYGVRYVSRAYDNPEDAARAYNELARLHHGEDAKLNIIPGDE